MKQAYKVINKEIMGIMEDIKLIMREKNGKFSTTAEEQLLDKLALLLLDKRVKIIKRI